MSSITSGMSRLMPRSSMSAIGVNLALACIESALFGIFFVLAMTSLAVLVGRHSNRSSNLSGRTCLSDRIWTSPLFVATMFLLMTVTSHWLITVRRTFDAFLTYEGGGDPMGYYLIVEAPTQVVATALVVTSVIIGDIILTYRIWIVWDRRWPFIVFPALCTLGYIALGASVVQLFASYMPMESIFMNAARARVITSAALTLATNLYGTGTIAYRIWASNRAMKHGHAFSGMGLTVTEALVIFIESAAFYTFWMIFFVTAFAAGSLLEAFAFHCIPAATGISFMLIVVRVGLGFHWSQIAGIGLDFVGRRPTVRKPPLAYPPRAITMNVTRTIEQETDYSLRLSPELRRSDVESSEDVC
ncbi:hypothetical protein C8Q70DRAFT_932979 [Cubamyces menziesii]|uniref:Uncharacterized protein n=1 Tax=Trametes cubensis TaxID=1111947 RepID=A0AAD7U2S2_9APHY|nr:hypothetical protein C8Q70DRAFT_932979 [Cubamyces menziesii]KAJ8496387.1 hypothetical protein ONZ51_g1139 [Trametes cubensis]